MPGNYTPPTTDALPPYFNQLHELTKGVLSGRVPAGPATRALDPIIAARFEGEGEGGDMGIVVAEFDLMVDCDRSPQDGVLVGQYTWSNEAITSANFPRRRVGQVMTHFEFIRFSDTGTTPEREHGLAARGLWAPDERDMFAVGEKRPDLQREFPLVFLGAACVLGGHRLLGILDGDSDDRGCSLLWDDPVCRWSPDCVFPGVRK